MSRLRLEGLLVTVWSELARQLVYAWLKDFMLSDLRWNVWSETVKSELGWSEAPWPELECLV